MSTPDRTVSRAPQQQQQWWQQGLHAASALAGQLQHNFQLVASNAQQTVSHLQRAATASLQRQQQQQQHGTAPLASMSAPPPPLPLTAAAPRAHGAHAHGTPPHAPAAPAHHAGGPVSREELGRATWLLLHTLAAQYPERPSRRQRRDARLLLRSLAGVYPCGECGQHFQQLLSRQPPDVSSGAALQAWMCAAHNTVNRRLGKPGFNCDLVGTRWAAMECGGEERACDLAVGAAPPHRRLRF